MARDGSTWLRALSAGESGSREAELADMADYIRRTLAKGFGAQLADADLEDLTQETLLKVSAKHASFAHDSRFSTWVAAVAVNTTLSELRRRRHQHVDLEEAIEQGRVAMRPAEGPKVVHRAERDRLLHDAIDGALTDRQREALMAELGGMPLAEIARRMESTHGAIYKMLHDARKRLKAHLEARGLGPSDLLPASTEASP